MSVLQRFLRIRSFRNRAAEYYHLAAGAFSVDVGARYLAVADHYIALAELEVNADKMERRKRLEDMRRDREKRPAARSSGRGDQPPAAPAPAPPKLRVIQGAGRSTSRPAALAARGTHATVLDTRHARGERRRPAAAGSANAARPRLPPGQ